jgi:hypothetical protein
MRDKTPHEIAGRVPTPLHDGTPPGVASGERGVSD